MGFHRAFHEWSMCMKITNCENERSLPCRKPTPLKRKWFLTRIGPLWNDDSWHQKLLSSWGAANWKTVCQIMKTCLFFRHTWEKSVYKNMFLVAKRELSWKMKWYCPSSFTLTIFLLQSWLSVKISLRIQWRASLWDDYDLTRLHCNKGLVAILLTQKGRSRVLPAVFIGNTVSEPKNYSKWATWHNTFNSESLGDCFLVLVWNHLYVDLNVHSQQNIKINFL